MLGATYIFMKQMNEWTGQGDVYPLLLGNGMESEKVSEWTVDKELCPSQGKSEHPPA